VPVTNAENVVRDELYINGVKYAEAKGRSVAMPVMIGDYIRRLRIRVVGYDAQNNVAGEDEMVVNDPKPPFRVHLQSSPNELSASIVKPPELSITGVDFYLGEDKLATVHAEPWAVPFDAAKKAVYARVVAHA